MTKVLNYAEKYGRDLDQVIKQGLLTAEIETPQVNFLDAKTFHVPSVAMSGYKSHSRNGGWNKGEVQVSNKPYTLSFDRDIELFVDTADVDETNQVASSANITREFLTGQALPEVDAYRFSKLAQGAGVSAELDIATATPEDVVKALKADIGKVRKYGTANLVAYVSSDVMEAVEAFRIGKGSIELLNAGTSVETRVTVLDGVRLVEVFDVDRFVNKHDFTVGFKPAVDAKRINWIVVAKPAVIAKAKLNTIFLFAPGQHTQGDGYLYQNRMYHDLFILENKKDGVVVSLAKTA
ncbi:hypothetical protein [Bacillus paranthracis]|uniref:hypothetical protein n=1 Tax=Bacillus paranthracis TaxID=2026186 RepID=UPI003D65BA7C